MKKRQDIIDEVVKATGEEPAKVKRIFEETVSAITQMLRDGEDVVIRGFGSFRFIYSKEKTARNISKGTSITIPARERIKFAPGTEVGKYREIK